MTMSHSACMTLLGIPSLKAVLHKTLLNVFVSIIRNPNSIELEIAKRQLLMREKPQKSMFTHIQSILEQYELSSIFHLISSIQSRMETYT